MKNKINSEHLVGTDICYWNSRKRTAYSWEENKMEIRIFLKLTAISSNLPNSSVRYLSIGGLIYSQ